MINYNISLTFPSSFSLKEKKHLEFRIFHRFFLQYPQNGMTILKDGRIQFDYKQLESCIFLFLWGNLEEKYCSYSCKWFNNMINWLNDQKIYDYKGLNHGLHILEHFKLCCHSFLFLSYIYIWLNSIDIFYFTWIL